MEESSRNLLAQNILSIEKRPIVLLTGRGVRTMRAIAESLTAGLCLLLGNVRCGVALLLLLLLRLDASSTGDVLRWGLDHLAGDRDDSFCVTKDE